MVVQDKKTKKTVEFEYRKVKHKESDYFQKEFVNVGPYESYEEEMVLMFGGTQISLPQINIMITYA